MIERNGRGGIQLVQHPVYLAHPFLEFHPFKMYEFCSAHNPTRRDIMAHLGWFVSPKCPEWYGEGSYSPPCLLGLHAIESGVKSERNLHDTLV